MFSKFIPFQRSYLLLMGAPGVGKTLLGQRFNEFYHLSTGELLRAAAARNSPDCQKIKKQMAQGLLLSDADIMRHIIDSGAFLQRKPVLLDGFPRTERQWGLCSQNFGSPLAAINLRTSRDNLRRQLLARGREDDQRDIIERRISLFYDEILPVSNKILADIGVVIDLDVSETPPDEVYARVREQLEQHQIITTDVSALSRIEPL